MDQIIIVIAGLLKVYGILGLFFIGLIIVLLCLLYSLGKKIIELYIPKCSEKNINPEESGTFLKIDNLLVYKISRLKIYCPLRKVIFKSLLRVHIGVYKEVLFNIIKADVNSMTTEQFRHYLENSLSMLFIQCREKYKENNLPEIAIEKFLEFNQSNEELLMKVMYQICDSEMVYDNNLEKLISFVDFVGAVLEMVLVSAENTLNELDGELSQVEYNGVKCQHCKEGCPLNTLVVSLDEIVKRNDKRRK
ncbi:MAG: hypothetical protein ACP6IQ_02325 [Candidatus Njordarchaeia archaeon]